MGPEARLADAAQQVLERLEAQEVHPLGGQVKLDLLRRTGRLTPRPEHGLVTLGHPRRLLQREHPLVNQPLDDLVEELGQLPLDLLVPLVTAGGVAAQDLEHLGSELPRLDQRVQDRVAERVE